VSHDVNPTSGNPVKWGMIIFLLALIAIAGHQMDKNRKSPDAPVPTPSVSAT